MKKFFLVQSIFWIGLLSSFGQYPTPGGQGSYNLAGITVLAPVGGTNEDGAVENAISNGVPIALVPNKNYWIYRQIVLTNNSAIIGNNATFTMATNLTGPMILWTNAITNVVLNGLIFDGQGYGFKGTGLAGGSHPFDFTSAFVGIVQNVANDRSGIYINSSSTNSVVTHCIARGFTSYGFICIGTTAFPQPASAQVIFDNCSAENCWAGFGTTNNGEYVTPNNLAAYNCGWGFDIESGNDFFTGGQAVVCGVGVHVSGYHDNNPAHSTVNGMTINHCYQAALCEGINNGYTFLNCNVEGDGAIVLSNCTGIVFQNCTLTTHGTFDQTFGADILVDGTGQSAGNKNGTNIFTGNRTIVGALPPQVLTPESGKVNIGAAPVAISFPATTTKWTNGTPNAIELYINNTGVTGTVIAKNGTTIETVLTGPFRLDLQPGEYFSETYTVGTPSATYLPK